jgi:large subunit ribosomal protein L13
MTMMKTYMAKAADLQNREWFTVDATDLTLGRMATKIARVLLGKHKPGFTAHLDTGDFVIVLNAEKVKVTGRKVDQKDYPYWTGWRGGYKTPTYRELFAKDPSRVITLAVQRMLPKSTLGKGLTTKLKIYTGGEHPHAAQKPRPLDLSKI